jgi:hypothetical protein
MISLTQVANFIKTNLKWLILGSLTLFVLFFLLIVSTLTQKPSRPTPSLPFKITSGFEQDFRVLNFTFNLVWPEFGNEIVLPKIQNDIQELENKVVVIAKKLGFKSPPKKYGELFEWKEEHYLSFSPKERGLYFSFDTYKNPSPLRDGPQPTEESARKALESVLGDLGLKSSGLEVLSTDFLSGIPSEGIRTRTKLDANIVKFTLGYNLYDLEVIKTPKIPLSDIRFGHQNQLVRLEYTFPKKTEPAAEKQDLISQKEALELLNAGRATVVFFEPKGGTRENLKNFNIKNATINQVKLKYYQTDGVQDFLLPIFEFSGDATLTTGESGEIILFLSAIKNSSIKLKCRQNRGQYFCIFRPSPEL